MDHWRTVLFSDKNRLGQVNIQSGVVQDTLIPVSPGAHNGECRVFIWKRKR